MAKDVSSWSHNAVIYQIYPRSFFDSNGNGIGDLPGILQKLDYLKGATHSLGIDAIWLSPFYPSPMADSGYDISDYCDVDPLFGTLDDLKLLLRESHERGLKIIIDLVPNHTSDEHPWFRESKSSKQNSKRSWYIWHDSKPDGSPPNNWLSTFGGSAWEYDENTEQYYLHSFLAKQPDLNWENPEVRQAMKDVMRFWLDVGVDGFRIDAVKWMSKDIALRDNPLNPEYISGETSDPYHAFSQKYTQRGPKLFSYLKDMMTAFDDYADRFAVIEATPDRWDDISEYLEYYENINPILCAPFNFEGIYANWDALAFKKFIDDFQASLRPDYLPVYSFGNHDTSRLATRIGPDAARTAAMLLLTLPGMPQIYYGDEIGMTDTSIPSQKVQDTFEKNVPNNHLGRDPERTPLQWSAEERAGFTDGDPWLPIGKNYKTHNIAVEQQELDSCLNLYRQLIALRKEYPVLHSGEYSSFDCTEHVFAFRRTDSNERFVIFLNFGDEETIITSKELHGHVLLSTYLHPMMETLTGTFSLKPHEGIIVRQNQI